MVEAMEMPIDRPKSVKKTGKLTPIAPTAFSPTKMADPYGINDAVADLNQVAYEHGD